MGALLDQLQKIGEAVDLSSTCVAPQAARSIVTKSVG
jgi:hypothetical protein